MLPLRIIVPVVLVALATIPNAHAEKSGPGQGAPPLSGEFSGPALLQTNGLSDAGEDASPRIATDGHGRWLAVWESEDSLGNTIGNDSDILYSISDNAAATWSAPTYLNTNAPSDSRHDSAPAITTDGNGIWVVVWESVATTSSDLSSGRDIDIYVSRSTNNGTSWSVPSTLTTSMTTDSGEDRVPDIATDKAGHWVVVWESNDRLGGTSGKDSDILVSRSTNGGVSWSAPAALNNTAASDSRHDCFPRVDMNSGGACVAVWHTWGPVGSAVGYDVNVNYSRSANFGMTWSTPARLNAALATTTKTVYNLFPQISADAGGGWIAIWESSTDDSNLGYTPNVIRFSRSANNGVTWSPAALVDGAGATNGRENYGVAAVSTALGKRLAAWSSDDSTDRTNHDNVYVSSFDTSTGIWSAPLPITDPTSAVKGRGAWLGLAANRVSHEVITAWESHEDFAPGSGADGDIAFGFLEGPKGTRSWTLYE